MKINTLLKGDIKRRTLILEGIQNQYPLRVHFKEKLPVQNIDNVVDQLQQHQVLYNPSVPCHVNKPRHSFNKPFPGHIPWGPCICSSYQVLQIMLYLPRYGKMSLPTLVPTNLKVLVA